MLSKWPIRNKLLVGIGLLVVIVSMLSASGLLGVYAYRSLVKSLRDRATELPLAAKLSEQIGDLRVVVGQVRGLGEITAENDVCLIADAMSYEKPELAHDFATDFASVKETLTAYRKQLLGNDGDSDINDSHAEWQTVREIDVAIAGIEKIRKDVAWLSDRDKVNEVNRQLGRLQGLARRLPSYLHQRIYELAGDVRTQYRTLIGLSWITTFSVALMMALLIRLFYTWVFRPLRLLVKGSRRVAGGEFSYRIRLNSRDEMSELAEAMNDMTARFQAIRDDLDRQVQERTKQVVRSEQLASVGFLAAGVAHEINNPLASIAMCAESLEGRIDDLLQTHDAAAQFSSTALAGQSSAEEQDVIRTYLRMIQDEAFRCKGITERLLDFSRIGDVQRQNTDLRELVQGVIDMVGHLGRYNDKEIEFVADDAVLAPVNAQEIKQVVLNLITNGLDAVSPGGKLRIALAERGAEAELIFEDNGCGMTDEVREHLFEPFFTRKRCGQGTGLGLSITYRIVADHNGRIDAESAGPGTGSEFRVSLPLTEEQKEREHRYQVA